MDLTAIRTQTIAYLSRIRSDAPELIVVLVIGAMLRIYNLAEESIWLDEAYSIVVSDESSWWYLFVEHSGVDPHPPLHYLLTKLWITLFSNSEFSTRMLSVLLSLAAIPVVYFLGRHLFDRFVGALAAVLMTVSPFQIWYAQEVRMYALFVLLTAASFYAFVRLMDHWSQRRLITYAVISALLGDTHVYALFILFIQGLFALYRLIDADRPSETPLALSFRQVVTAFGATGVLLSPWLVALLVRLQESTDRISWISPPEIDDFRRAFTAATFGFTSDAGYHLTPPVIWILLLAIGCILLAIISPSFKPFIMGRYGPTAEEQRNAEGPSHVRPAVVLLVMWAVLPIIIAWLVSVYITPLFLLRAMIAMSPAFLLLFAVGARSFAGLPVPNRPILPVVVAILLVSGMLMPLPSYYANDHKEQWNDAATFVDEGANPGDVVILAPSYIDRSFLYYFDRDDVHVVAISPDEDPQASFDSDTDPDQVFLVIRGLWGEDRDRLIDDAGGIAGLTHHQHEQHFIGLDVYQYSVLTLEFDDDREVGQLGDNFTQADLPTGDDDE